MTPQGTPSGVAQHSDLVAGVLERQWDFAEVAAIPLPPGWPEPLPELVCETSGVPSKARMLREALGISIRALARDLGYDHGYLSKVENGKRGWSLHGALAWMDYMALQVARARQENFHIPDSAIPTLRELALVRPDRRASVSQETPTRQKRAKKVPRKAGKGGKTDARGKVRRRPRG